MFDSKVGPKRHRMCVVIRNKLSIWHSERMTSNLDDLLMSFVEECAKICGKFWARATAAGRQQMVPVLSNSIPPQWWKSIIEFGCGALTRNLWSQTRWKSPRCTYGKSFAKWKAFIFIEVSDGMTWNRNSMLISFQYGIQTNKKPQRNKNRERTARMENNEQ